MTSNSLIFDTHRFVKRMIKAGVSEQQAEALVETQVEMLNAKLDTITSNPPVLDTHRLIKRLTEAGMPEQQAEALVEYQIELLNELAGIKATSQAKLAATKATP